MRAAGSQRGMTFVEVLVSLAVFSLASIGIAGMLIDNSRINRDEQLRAEVQAAARATVSLLVERIRGAGWDPLATGFQGVVLDDDPGDAESWIELHADHDGDGTLDGPGESMRIRHLDGNVEWRLTASGPYVPLATNISNDEDGDGTPEPLFVADTATPPAWIRVRVTAESSLPGAGGTAYRYTAQTRVALRGNL